MAGDQHISFTTTKIGSLIDIKSSRCVCVRVGMSVHMSVCICTYIYIYTPTVVTLTHPCPHHCRDEEGLRCFYYLVQDVKCLVFSLIGLHFKIKPI